MRKALFSGRTWQWLVAAAALAILVLVARGSAHEFERAFDAIPFATLLALAGLHWLALLLRAVAWNLSLAPTRAMVPAPDLHMSSSLRFLADTGVPTYVGAFVRIGILRGSLRDKAPTAGQMLAGDWILLVVEIAITAATVTVLAVTTGARWYWVLGAIVLAVAAWTLSRGAARRWPHHAFSRTLDVLKDRRIRVYLTVLLFGVLAIQPLRFWLVLNAVDIDATGAQAIATFIVTSAFGILPVGPGPAGLGATASVFSGEGGGTASAVAVAMAGTATVGALAYTVVAGPAFLIALRRRRRARREAADAVEPGGGPPEVVEDGRADVGGPQRAV